MFYIGLIVGLFIGANVGLIVSRLLTSAKLSLFNILTHCYIYEIKGLF